MIFIIVLFGIVSTTIILGMVVNYNRLIELNIKSKNAWANVDVELTRRHDLIPNLVASVSEYAKHEKETFRVITQLRSQAIDSQSIKDRGEKEATLSKALTVLMGIAENYPVLKADKNFLELQSELIETENAISAVRRNYNAMSMEYNTFVQSFPYNFIAELFNFKAKDFFQLDNTFEARKVPEIKIN